VAGQPTYCNDRCRDYVPLPLRLPDGDYFIVAGPVEHCAACRMVIMPSKPHGYIMPCRGKDGRLYCGPVCRKRGPSHPDNEVFSAHEWRTVVSSDGVTCEICVPGVLDRPSWHAKQAKLETRKAAA
jgi:hypothetical protein